MPVTISGSGTITGIATGGLPDGSITSADLASGAITSGALPSGSILQVVSGSTSTSAAMTTSSYADTNLSATITPKAANSNIFVIVDQRTYHSTSGQGFGLRIMRNTTPLHIPTQDANGPFDWYFAVSDRHIRATLTFMDSAVTYTLGDTLTYKTQGLAYTASGITFQPTSAVEGSTSYITLMEVAE